MILPFSTLAFCLTISNPVIPRSEPPESCDENFRLDFYGALLVADHRRDRVLLHEDFAKEEITGVSLADSAVAALAISEIKSAAHR